MAYHDLSECTLNDEERREEASRILQFIQEELDDDEDNFLTERQTEFIGEMLLGGPVSVKQLFWLRDIKDKL